MNTQRTMRTGLAALALTIATSTLIFQPSTATAAACSTPDCRIQPKITDIAVKYVSTDSVRDGTLQVKFEVKNVGTANVPSSDIQLMSHCWYAYLKTKQVINSGGQLLPFVGLNAGSPGVPVVVSCPPKADQFVSSVSLQAAVTGDVHTLNNIAFWNYTDGGHSF